VYNSTSATMRKSSSFMCVLVVLLAGGAEAQRPLVKEALFGLATLQGITVVASWRPQDGCVPMGEIYTDGPDMLRRMWNNAFEVVDNEAEGYTFWWFEGGNAGTADAHDNPNDAVTRAIWNQSAPDTCDVQYFHKSAPSPEADDFTECHPWHANSCCHQATVVTPQAISTGYGAGYEWDRCGPLSQACERFFVMEGCFYECEVNAGLYRKFTDEQHQYCSEAAEGAYIPEINYTCQVSAWGGNAENRWQLDGMPIRRSMADSWYRACKNDLFCGTGDYFACAGDYHAQLAAEAANTTYWAARFANESAAKLAAAQREAEENANKLPQFGVVIIIVAVSMVLLLVLCTVSMAHSEKAGRPVFKPAAAPTGGSASTTAI